MSALSHLSARSPSQLRRRTFLGLMALGSAGSLLAACSPPPPAAPTTAPPVAPKPTAAPTAAAPTAAPKPAATAVPAAAPTTAPAVQPTTAPQAPTGQLRVAVPALNAQNLDPIIEPAGAKTWLVAIYDHLVGIDATASKLDPTTGIATKWQAAPDQLSWTFTLRDGVKFHTGDPVTSADVKFSLDRMLSPKSEASYAGQLRTQIDRVEAPDPRTVVVRLKQPAFLLPYALSGLGGLEGVVLSKKYIEEKGDTEFASRPVGSGPYRFAEFVPGSHIAFEAGATHYAEGAPKYQRVRFLEVPEESTRVAMLRRGEADVVGISSETAEEVQRAGFGIFQLEDSIRVEIKLLQQWKSESVLSERRVREALNLAVNRQEIVDTILKSQGAPAYTWLGSWGLGYEDKPAIPYNPTRAKQLLAEAGHPNGLTLNFYLYPRPRFPEGPLIGQAIIGYWEAIGVRSNVTNIDFGVFRPRWQSRELPDPAVAGPQPTTNRLLWHSTATLNYHSKGDLPHTFNAELDGLVEGLTKAATEQEYVQRIRAVQNYVVDNWLQLPVVTGSQSFGASKAIKKWNLGRTENAINLRDLLRNG